MQRLSDTPTPHYGYVLTLTRDDEGISHAVPPCLTREDVARLIATVRAEGFDVDYSHHELAPHVYLVYIVATLDVAQLTR